MPGAGDLEEDFLLALQNNLAIVGAARKIHQPVELHQLLAAHRRARSLSTSLAPARIPTAGFRTSTPDPLRRAILALSAAFPAAVKILPPAPPQVE